MTFEGLQQIDFRLLAKREDREIVFGLIGTCWTSSAEILPFQPEDFVSFHLLSINLIGSATPNQLLSTRNPHNGIDALLFFL